MKTKLSVLLVVMAMLLAACGGGSSKLEGVALDYVNIFVDGSDKEKKEKFVEDHVHEESAPLYLMGLAFDTGEAKEASFKNAKAVETVTFKENGESVDAVLVKADNNQEIIVLFSEGKIVFAFSKESGGETDTGYNEIRSKFKA